MPFSVQFSLQKMHGPFFRCGTGGGNALTSCPVRHSRTFVEGDPPVAVGGCEILPVVQVAQGLLYCGARIVVTVNKVTVLPSTGYYCRLRRHHTCRAAGHDHRENRFML